MKIASIVVIAWLATSTEGRLLGRGRGKNKGSSTTPWEQPDTTAATDAPPVTSLLPSLPRYVRMSNTIDNMVSYVIMWDMCYMLCTTYVICNSFSLFFIAYLPYRSVIFSKGRDFADTSETTDSGNTVESGSSGSAGVQKFSNGSRLSGRTEVFITQTTNENGQVINQDSGSVTAGGTDFGGSTWAANKDSTQVL